MVPTLYACGSNAGSQLALNHPEDTSTLTPTVFHPSVSSMESRGRILDLTSASSHSLLLLRDPSSDRNLLLGAGTNTFGQLGPRCALWDDIKPEPRWKPLNLAISAGLEDDWEPIKIASTWTTSIVVYQRLSRSRSSTASTGSAAPASSEDDPRDGDGPEQMVMTCGSNDFGELGSCPPDTLQAPAEIPISQASRRPTVVDLELRLGETVEMIKGGQRHVIAIVDGSHGQRVIGWGASRKGELDASTVSSSNTAVSTIKPAGKGKGKGKAIARPSTSPPTLIDLPIPAGCRVVDLALGASHSLVLLSNGQVLGWGSDIKGQITDVHHLARVRQIAATWGGSYFLTRDGLYSQGANTHGQLLHPDGSASKRAGIGIPDAWEAERIVAGSEHLLALARKEGEEALLTGGWNEHGNLALGDQVDRSSLTRVILSERIGGMWGGCASTWISVEG
ncbi:hypothetical protein IAU60_004838 [Kwoniella sp. DSM 27419]